MHKLIFGPIPSRRLGFSLGINHVHAKTCSYACVYCQVGATTRMTIERQQFYEPDEIYQAVADMLDEARRSNQQIDYLSFVPDGEPTLDVNLGTMIDLLRPFAVPIAVISNASLIWREDVRADLSRADWVSLKFDAVQEESWKRVNRPHGRLSLDAIKEGARAFADEFSGKLVSETMLVSGVNDSTENLRMTAEFLHDLNPTCAYVLVPTRPPHSVWVQPPDGHTLNRAYQVYSENLDNVRLLTEAEPGSFAQLGEAVDALISILAVHPMRTGTALEYLANAGEAPAILNRLVESGAVSIVEYLGESYYIALPNMDVKNHIG